jgi:hypothetical protein
MSDNDSGEIQNETQLGDAFAGYSYRETGNSTALYAALATAQGMFLPAKKSATNPHFKSKFAPLEEVIAATKEGLASNGLAVIQPTVQGPDGLYLLTKLTHAEGGAIETMVPLGKFGTVHELASKITYLKRYTRSALLSVASDEDDDGNEAVAGDKSEARQDRSKPAAPPATTPRKPPTRPQDAPKPKEDPKPAPTPAEPAVVKSEPPPPAPTELLATADKTAELKAAFLALSFKGAIAKESIQLLAGKEYGLVTNADCDAVLSVLNKAIERKWNAEQVMLLLREDGMTAEGAVRAIEVESDVLGGP